MSGLRPLSSPTHTGRMPEPLIDRDEVVPYSST
jgi:hypothetical protein